MMIRLLMFVGLVGVILTSYATHLSQFVMQKFLAQTVEVDPEVKQQILDATVKISLFTPVLDETGQPQLTETNGQQMLQFIVAEGMGTVIRQNGSVLIVTHDHWLLDGVTTATFADVKGEVLLTVTAVQFQQMILYRDGGTMILALGGNWPGKVAASRAQQTVERDDVLLLAYRQPATGQIDVVPVVVDELMVYQERPSYYLRSLHNEAVVQGNSGGGVFIDSELAGNMWGRLVTQGVTPVTGTAVGPKNQTNLSIAAQLPD